MIEGRHGLSVRGNASGVYFIMSLASSHLLFSMSFRKEGALFDDRIVVAQARNTGLH